MIFNRGSIGTDGTLRAGEPYKYSYGDTVKEFTLEKMPFTLVIERLEPGVNTVVCKVFFKAGPQPLDNLRNPSGQALQAGELEKEVQITGLTAAYVGAGDNTDVAETTQETITSNGAEAINQQGFYSVTYTDGTAEEGYQLITPIPEVDTEGQVVLIPESLTLVGIREWEPFSSSWVWLNNDKEASLDAFIKSEDAVEIVVSGTTVMYNKYVWDVKNGDNTLTVLKNFRFVLE